MSSSKQDTKGIAALLASKGRYGDTMLAHINPQEAAILKAMGGSGTINPETGLPEYWPSWVEDAADAFYDNTVGLVVGPNSVTGQAVEVARGVTGAAAEAIQKTGYANKNLFYTRHPNKDSGAQEIPRELWSYSSGPVALGIAAQNLHSVIYLLGFDLGPSQTGKFNNVYADTEFYKKRINCCF